MEDGKTCVYRASNPPIFHQATLTKANRRFALRIGEDDGKYAVKLLDVMKCILLQKCILKF